MAASSSRYTTGFVAGGGVSLSAKPDESRIDNCELKLNPAHTGES